MTPDDVRICPNCGKEPVVRVRLIAIEDAGTSYTLSGVPKLDEIATGWFCRDCRILLSEEDFE